MPNPVNQETINEKARQLLVDGAMRGGTIEFTNGGINIIYETVEYTIFMHNMAYWQKRYPKRTREPIDRALMMLSGKTKPFITEILRESFIGGHHWSEKIIAVSK